MPSKAVARRALLPRDLQPIRTIANQAFSRTAGAPLVEGNAVRVLRDAAENYPVWEAAMRAARETIHIEMYIFHRDRVGRRFVDLLVAKAREGVCVRVLYDWFGCGTGPLLGFFRPLIAAGAEVRAFNPPSITAALGWVRRNHRKLIVVDGRIAFVGGLCIGEAWEGLPEKRREPWRDTGIEILGPAVAHAEDAFAESWRLAGGVVPAPGPTPDGALAPAGSVNLRLIATEPFTANLLRLDLLISTLATKRLWITDAYFIGTGAYLEGLKRAAHDGVDVRLLLPRGSDVLWTVPVSRSLYRPLLEAGVRIFEWNGTMVHAKTAVADSRWARIGSTNLNLNSWMGNWELDAAVEDEAIAHELEAHYEADLARSTEILVKMPAGSPRPARPEETRPATAPRRPVRRMVRSVTGIGQSIGAAVTGHRSLEAFERVPLIGVGALLGVAALVGFYWPRAVAWPLATLGAWIAVTLLAEAWSLNNRH